LAALQELQTFEKSPARRRSSLSSKDFPTENPVDDPLTDHPSSSSEHKP
jgi:hypothetical protein